MAAVTGPIVVGVSARTGSPGALRWAADEAHRRGAEVVAVLAWRPARPPAAPAGRPPAVSTTQAAELAAQSEAQLQALVSSALGPDHGVQCRAVHGKAIEALLEAGATAQLLVLDAPRPGRAAKLRTSLLGPQLIYAAPCPVVVIPPQPADRPTPGARSARTIASAAAASAAAAGRPGLRVSPPPAS